MSTADSPFVVLRSAASWPAEELADIAEDEALIQCALDLTGTTRNDAYEAALAILRDDTRGGTTC
jgi:hypothetical protein